METIDMKTRNDFVSNSSSSSFIFICENGQLVKPNINPHDLEDDEGLVVLPLKTHGQAEFGWQNERYYDFWSKLNWAALIALSMKDIEESARKSNSTVKNTYKFSAMENLIKMVCKKELDLNVRLMTEQDREGTFVYIDHQSDIGENIANAAMFDSYTSMYNWLFRESYIQCGNDND